MFSMNRLSTEKRATILGMLVEGNSMRAAARMAGVSFNTVSKLLLDIGEAAARYHDEHMRDLPCKTVEADEICRSSGRRPRTSPRATRTTRTTAMFGRGPPLTPTPS